ncbi:MAG: VanZ family protein [bacterium]|nr:VanZ family protein [bacterium]
MPLSRADRTPGEAGNRGGRRIARPALRWALVLLWMALIFWLSSRPDIRTVPLGQDLGMIPPLGRHEERVVEQVLRKSAHVALYSVLAVLCHQAASMTGRWGMSLHPCRWSAAIGSVRGALDEVHQSLVPGRDARLADVGVNGLGVLAGLLLVLILSRERRHR